MNKPKLELELNKQYRLKLLNEKPVTGTNSYGEWYLYNVEYGDSEYSFFAPKNVVDRLNELEIKGNDTVEITKTIVKNGRKNEVHFSISKSPTVCTEILTENINSNGHSKEFKMMYNALKEAKEIKELLGNGIDVNKIGISLYISKNR